MKTHILAQLVCLGRRTVTGLITTASLQNKDWTAHYRLYSHDRIQPKIAFQELESQIQKMQAPSEPFVVAIDDTIRTKTGTKIDGVSYKRDPLGPPFQTNLIKAQRFLQFSAAVPQENGSAKLIPIHFQHAPSAKKPKANASTAQLQEYKECQKQLNLNTYAITEIESLRKRIPEHKEMILCVDGSYTNGTVIKALPEKTTLIGRTRKDAVFCKIPNPEQSAKGRKRLYGDDIQSPEDIRKCEKIPYQKVEAFASGKKHQFKVKVVQNIMWRKAGACALMQLVVIAPLGYRLKKGGKMLYRKPTYLLCTDTNLDIKKLLQFYLWRWQIEVNFRDEKSLLGLGQAQVRTPQSNLNLPALNVLSYSMLWLAALKTDSSLENYQLTNPPKWRTSSNYKKQVCTSDLLRTIREEIWAKSIVDPNFTHFMNSKNNDKKCVEFTGSLTDALKHAA